MLNFGLASGYITQAAFTSDTDHLLKNWRSLVTGTSVDWVVESQCKVEYSTVRRRALGGRNRNLGTARLSSWYITITRDMAGYLEDTIFDGDTDALVTVQVYDVYRKEYAIFNAVCNRVELIDGEDGENKSNEWLVRLRLDFSSAVVAAAS